MEKKEINRVTDGINTSITYVDGGGMVFANGDRNIATEWTPDPLDNCTISKVDAGRIHLKNIINEDNINSINIHSFKNHK